MQKLLLRILFAIFIAFFLLFSYSAYQYYVALHSDDPIIPYVLVEKGGATVVRGELAIDMVTGDRYDLQEKDTIITKKDSLATVKWPDKSETRLGPSSRMQIDRMVVARDYSSIEIEFGLREGQAWSTVVRTIYPGSYFRTRIPGQGVIAGVRGTVYDIDLVRGYIHSVDHSVTLSDSRGNSVSLLPGELVSVTDILKKLGREIIDSTWNNINQAKDIIFLESHTLALRGQVDTLTGKSENLWDRFVRWILSFIPTFDDLQVMEELLGDTTGIDLQIPREKILGVYQKIQDTKFVQEREKLRSYILSSSGSLSLTQEQFQIFAQGAIWDSLSLSGVTLDTASVFVDNYVENFDSSLRSVLQVIPVSELDTKARETLRKLIK